MKYPKPRPQSVEKLCDYLRENAQGRDNAIPARDLAAALGLGRSGDRRLRALAHAANEKGVLVCTGDKGYFIPTSPDEVEETIGRLESQGVEMLDRARKLKALLLRNFPAQQVPLL